MIQSAAGSRRGGAATTISWQRERTVASSWWGSWVTRIVTACGGGSSIDLSSAFCTISDIAWARA